MKVFAGLLANLLFSKGGAVEGAEPASQPAGGEIPLSAAISRSDSSELLAIPSLLCANLQSKLRWSEAEPQLLSLRLFLAEKKRL